MADLTMEGFRKEVAHVNKKSFSNLSADEIYSRVEEIMKKPQEEWADAFVEYMKELNEKKANLLYDYLDSQDYYFAPVKKDSRSMMNVTFVTGDADLDKKFASEAGKAGLKNLKGHRSVGGMRASIYNAMPYEGVEALVAFMKKFAEENPKA